MSYFQICLGVYSGILGLKVLRNGFWVQHNSVHNSLLKNLNDSVEFSEAECTFFFKSTYWSAQLNKSNFRWRIAHTDYDVCVSRQIMV